MAHFKIGGPVYDDALSRLNDTQGPLLLMLPTDLAASLRQELDGCDGLRVEWEAVADGNLLALLHRDAADECHWDKLAPHLTGRHVCMATAPKGHPRPAWDDLIVAFHDHGILPDDTWREVQLKTLGRDYRSSGTLFDRGGTTSGCAISALGRRPPASQTPAASAVNATRCPPQRRQAPTGARSAPRWPRAPGSNLPQVAQAHGVKWYRGASRSVRPSTLDTHGTLR